jgi:hypothetical protein
MDPYWEAVRLKVCRKCIDSDGHGNCRLPSEETCGLEVFFPELVATVNAVQSDSYDGYLKALRQNICAHCEHQSAEGMCRKRDSLECALDRYFPMVVEAIEAIKVAMPDDAQRH